MDSWSHWYHNYSVELGPLDYRITRSELNEASYVLRPDKSTGYDSLSNELIKCLVESNPGIVLKLLNLVFDSNTKIEQWTMAIIIPILKSGPKMDPSNYRGISILSCLSKLYTAILNKRLMAYAIEKGILKPEALGFVAGQNFWCPPYSPLPDTTVLSSEKWKNLFMLCRLQ